MSEQRPADREGLWGQCYMWPGTDWPCTSTFLFHLQAFAKASWIALLSALLNAMTYLDFP